MTNPTPAKEHTGDIIAHDALLIRIATELYAVSSTNVRGVIRYRAITAVPGAPPTLPGILNQRGAILPVIELRQLLGLGPAQITRASRFVLAVHEEIEVALLVDAVLDLISLPDDTIEPVPSALDPARARFLRGVAQYDRQTIVLLELGEVIANLRDWA